MSKNDTNLLTPRGTGIYPHLNQADTKWDADGKYHVKLAFDADDPQVQAFLTKLEGIRDARYQEAYDALVADKKTARAKELKTVPVLKVEVDEETGEETGRLIANVGMKAKFTSKKTGKVVFMKPDFFNAKRENLKNPPRISGGSILRAFVDPYAYVSDKDKEVGISLRLNSIQIIKLVSGGARDPGFDVEEDGDDITDGADTSDENTSAGGDTDGDDDL